MKLKLRDIGPLRLAALGVTTSVGSTVAEVVAHLGAMQAQDYLGALWSIGLRLPGVTEADVEAAIAERTIVRTWPMRGTLHFVAAEDVRWMLKLMTPRILSGSAARHRQLELDEAVFARSEKLIVRELKDGRVRTREELFALLERSKIDPAGQRGIHILSKLAMEGVICFGPRAGKQPTFVLLDDWLSVTRTLDHEAALVEIARRYFTSHGPATLADFERWTGLKITDARKGLEVIKDTLVQYTMGEDVYWMAEPGSAGKARSGKVHLLPGFDEFLLGYKDRSAVVPAEQAHRIVPGGNGMFMPTMVSKGQVTGMWNRELKGKRVLVDMKPFLAGTTAQGNAFVKEARLYAKFLGKEAVFSAARAGES